jgi:hypothetical protein
MSTGRLFRALNRTTLPWVPCHIAKCYALRCDKRGNTCRVSMNDIARDAGANRSTVLRAVKVLVAAGVITASRPSRREPYVIAFTDPSNWPQR